MDESVGEMGRSSETQQKGQTEHGMQQRQYTNLKKTHLSGMLEKLRKERRVGERVVRIVSNLVLYALHRATQPYLLSRNTLGHDFNGSSARSDIRVVQFHASNELHHGSRAETDLPLFVGLSHSSNRLLGKCLHG